MLGWLFGWFWKKELHSAEIQPSQPWPHTQRRTPRPMPTPKPPGPTFAQDPSAFGRCKHCEKILSRRLPHYCPTTNTQYDSGDQGDFLLSLVVGEITGNPLLGGLVGGDMVGGLVGAELAQSFDTPSQVDDSPQMNNDQTPDISCPDPDPVIDNSCSDSIPDSSNYDSGSFDSGCCDSSPSCGD